MVSIVKFAVATEPTKQQLVDYMNAAAKINLYAYAITNQNMPQLQHPPKNYGEFAASFSPAKAHCLTWTNSIFPNILEFPKQILQADGLFQLEDSEIGLSLDILAKDPTNAKAKAALEAALKGIQLIVQNQHKAAEGLIANLNQFAVDIAGDAKILTAIAEQALKDVTDDKDMIKKIGDDIQRLHDDIAAQNAWLKVSAVGIIASILVFLGGVLICLIPGAQGFGAGVAIFGVLGMAGSTAGVILAGQRIQGDKDQIVTDQKNIKEYNQDIILLQHLNEQFKRLVSANQDAQAAMGTVVKMFKDLDSAIGEVIADLGKVGTDVTGAHYAQAKIDLAAADKAWQELLGFAKALGGISYAWTDSEGKQHDFAKESPPMDAGQVTDIAKAA